MVITAAHCVCAPRAPTPQDKLLLDEMLEPLSSVLTPLPGTDLESEATARLMTREHAYYDLAHPVMDLADRDVERFYREMRGLYRRN